jgi:hypothetical protein
MGVEKDNDPPDPQADSTPLAPGVWITEATGFASVPPRAQSDLCDVRDENERKQERGKEGEASTDVEAEPRIERYRER